MRGAVIFNISFLQRLLSDAEASIVVTADKTPRGGKLIELEKIVTEALKQIDCVKKVLLWERTGGNSEKSRDSRVVNLMEACERMDKFCEPETMNSEDGLFTLYTSGSTGKPKGYFLNFFTLILYPKIFEKPLVEVNTNSFTVCAWKAVDTCESIIEFELYLTLIAFEDNNSSSVFSKEVFICPKCFPFFRSLPNQLRIIFFTYTGFRRGTHMRLLLRRLSAG